MERFSFEQALASMFSVVSNIKIPAHNQDSHPYGEVASGISFNIKPSICGFTLKPTSLKVDALISKTAGDP